ncbi:hypothetical protein ANANG_G00257800 [Anguilla anguilla]|uniref:Uncharacterized protein n=1 Tax=Anguilla anguilla TaxID=7936 RepID=A0A9D3LN97_ANGAN|nr:hypothetical protein ANANG_G00257800 [Anguilla anguilla]
MTPRKLYTEDLRRDSKSSRFPVTRSRNAGSRLEDRDSTRPVSSEKEGERERGLKIRQPSPFKSLGLVKGSAVIMYRGVQTHRETEGWRSSVDVRLWGSSDFPSPGRDKHFGKIAAILRFSRYSDFTCILHVF